MHMHNGMQLYAYRCMYMLNEVNGCVLLLWCIGTYVCMYSMYCMLLTCMYKSVIIIDGGSDICRVTSCTY